MDEKLPTRWKPKTLDETTLNLSFCCSTSYSYMLRSQDSWVRIWANKVHGKGIHLTLVCIVLTFNFTTQNNCAFNEYQLLAELPRF
ncbi:hypothetical protein QYF36_023938 [Acer negundo]|nr:hypothetical protein QYF36_023938 [Acer negundo]